MSSSESLITLHDASSCGVCIARTATARLCMTLCDNLKTMTKEGCAHAEGGKLCELLGNSPGCQR